MVGPRCSLCALNSLLEHETFLMHHRLQKKENKYFKHRNFNKNLKWVAKLMHRQDNTALQYDIIKNGREEK